MEQQEFPENGRKLQHYDHGVRASQDRHDEASWTRTMVVQIQETFLDLTFCSEGGADKITGWRVLEDETLSDHRHVTFEVQRDVEAQLPPGDTNAGRRRQTTIRQFEKRPCGGCHQNRYEGM